MLFIKPMIITFYNFLLFAHTSDDAPAKLKARFHQLTAPNDDLIGHLFHRYYESKKNHLFRWFVLAPTI